MSEAEPYDPGFTHCSQEGCAAGVKNNRWAKIKSGWFFARDESEAMRWLHQETDREECSDGPG